MTDDLEVALRRIAAGPDQRTTDAGTERIVRRLETMPLPPQSRPLRWWPAALSRYDLAPAWPRLATLAAAAVLGISIGLSGLGTRIATDLDLVRVSAADRDISAPRPY